MQLSTWTGPKGFAIIGGYTKLNQYTQSASDLINYYPYDINLPASRFKLPVRRGLKNAIRFWFLKAYLHWRTSARMSAGPPVDQVIFPSGHYGPQADVRLNTSGPPVITRQCK
jgi:hypothetical protein